MKKSKIFTKVLIRILAAITIMGWLSPTMPVLAGDTTNPQTFHDLVHFIPGNIGDPNRDSAVQGNRVVWADSRNGNFDIFMYDWVTRTETPICTAAGDQKEPSIYENKIVWADKRYGDWDIYMYDLETKAETQVCTVDGEQRFPSVYVHRISKDKSITRVVWQDHRSGNPDIYMYESPASGAAPFTTLIAGGNDLQYQPLIYKDRIIWYQNYAVYLHDLVSGGTIQIGGGTPKDNPSIYENKVVYQDKRKGNFDIYLYDLETGKETEICTNAYDQWFPKIYKDKIVWEDNRNNKSNSSYDVYVYDLSTQTETPICTTDDGQKSPFVYENKIIWFDNRQIKLEEEPAGEEPTEEEEEILKAIYDGQKGGSFNIFIRDWPVPLSPTITSISPSRNFVGGVPFNITVYGTNFVVGSKVLWNGKERPTTYISPIQLQAEIGTIDEDPTTTGIQNFDLAKAGTVDIKVVQPTIDELSSNIYTFEIIGAAGQPPIPSIPVPQEPLTADSYTKLLMHLDGPSGSVNFTDSSDTPKTITGYGDVKIDTTNYISGNASAFFDGTGDYLTLPDSDEWSFGSGDFTIDFWIKFNSAAGDQTIISQWPGDNKNYWSVGKNSADKLFMLFYKDSLYMGSYVMASVFPWSVDTWYHLAFVRTGATGLIFINGVSQALIEDFAFGSNDVGNIACDLIIGEIAGTQYVNGWLDEVRISKGIARYFGPTEPSTPSLPPVLPAALLPSQIFVDDNYNQNSSGGHIWKYDAFSNIQEAINNVAGGGTVIVAAGSYNLTSPVSIDKPVVLIGDITAPGNIVVNGPVSGGVDKDCFHIMSDGVTIKGFKIQNAIDRTERSDGNAAIDIGGARSLTPLPGLKNINILNNEIYNNAYGIYLYCARHINISNNKIFASNVDNRTGHRCGKGIVVYGEGIAPKQTYDVKILNNEIYKNRSYGIELNNNIGGNNTWQDMGIVIDGNKIYENGSELIVGSKLVYDSQGISISDYTQGVTISNNVIYSHQTRNDSRFSPTASGIKASNSKDLNINGNDIYENMRGIYIYGALSSGCKVTNNTVRNNAQGVVFEGATVGSIERSNSIYNNNNNTYVIDGIQPYGVLNLGTGNVQATYNWWGAADGPAGAGNGTGDKISNNVFYGPWFSNKEKTGLSNDPSLRPTLNFTINDGAKYTRDRNVTIKLNATSVLFNVNQMILSEKPDFSNASWEPYVLTKSFQLSEAEGAKTVYCKVKDTGFNESLPVSASITLDTIEPIVTLDNLPKSQTNSRDVDIRVSGIGVVAYKYTLVHQVDGKVLQEYTSPEIFLSADENSQSNHIKRERLLDGDYTLTVIGRDAAENWQGKEKQPTLFTWKVDTQPPTASFEIMPALPDPPFFNESKIFFIKVNGVEFYKYKLERNGLVIQESGKDASGNDREIDKNTTIITSQLKDGSYLLTVFGRDAAGNWQQQASTLSWGIDLTNNKPTFESVSPSTAQRQIIDEGQSLDFIINNPTDPEGRVLTFTWFVDDSPQLDVPTATSRFRYTPDFQTTKNPGRSEHTIKATISDNDPDDEQKVSLQWTVWVNDVNTAPNIRAVSPTDATQNTIEGSALTFTIVALDREDTQLTIDWKVDEQPISSEILSNIPLATETTSSFIYAPDFASQGERRVKVEVFDGKARSVEEWSVSVGKGKVIPTLAWEFNTDGDTQGWINAGNLNGPVVEKGVYKATFDGKEPLMSLPSLDLNLDGSRYQTLRIRYKVSEGRLAQLLWITNPYLRDEQWQVRFGQQDFSIIGDGKFHIVEVDLSANPDWQGHIISWLRLKPVILAEAGEIEIDYIRIFEGAPALPVAWEFNTDGNAENWIGRNSLTPFVIENGSLKTEATGNDPVMSAGDPGSISIDADVHKGVQIRYSITCDTNILPQQVKEATAELFWMRSDSTKLFRHTFSVTPDGISHVYTLDLSNNPEWRGEITYLRFDPALTGPAEVEIDYIRIVTYPKVAPSWEFGVNAEGWRIYQKEGSAPHLTPFVIEGGILYTSITGDDPIIYNPLVSIDADSYKGISLRMKIGNGNNAAFFWSNKEGLHSYSFKVKPDNEFHTYNIDLSNYPGWQGNISYLRFDPIDEAEAKVGEVQIDFIKIVDNFPGPQDEFDVDNNTRDWVANSLGNVSVSGGKLRATVTGKNPFMIKETFNFPAAIYPYLQIQYRCTSGNRLDRGVLRWQSSDRRLGPGTKSFYINADGLFHTYTFDLSKESNWKDQIVQLSFYPTIGPANTQIEIEYIRFFKYPPTPEAPYWGFDNAGNLEGWILTNGLTNARVHNGLLDMKVSSVHPYMDSPLCEIDADIYKTIEIYYAVLGDSVRYPSLKNAQLQISWRGENERFHQERRKAVPINATVNSLQKYQISLSAVGNWKGKISQLRIQPVVRIPELANTSDTDSRPPVIIWIDYIRAKE